MTDDYICIYMDIVDIVDARQWPSAMGWQRVGSSSFVRWMRGKTMATMSGASPVVVIYFWQFLGTGGPKHVLIEMNWQEDKETVARYEQTERYIDRKTNRDYKAVPKHFNHTPSRTARCTHPQQASTLHLHCHSYTQLIHHLGFKIPISKQSKYNTYINNSKSNLQKSKKQLEKPYHVARQRTEISIKWKSN